MDGECNGGVKMGWEAKGMWGQSTRVQWVQEKGKIVRSLGLGERMGERRRVCGCAAGPRVTVDGVDT